MREKRETGERGEETPSPSPQSPLFSLTFSRPHAPTLPGYARDVETVVREEAFATRNKTLFHRKPFSGGSVSTTCATSETEPHYKATTECYIFSDHVSLLSFLCYQ